MTVDAVVRGLEQLISESTLEFVFFISSLFLLKRHLLSDNTIKKFETLSELITIDNFTSFRGDHWVLGHRYRGQLGVCFVNGIHFSKHIDHQLVQQRLLVLEVDIERVRVVDKALKDFGRLLPCCLLKIEEIFILLRG